MQQLFDLRDRNFVGDMAHGGPDEGTQNPDRTYVALARDATFLYRLDEGNRMPWDKLSHQIQATLPGNGHEQLHDISVGRCDVVIDGRCGHEAVMWMCGELERRSILPSSAPVTLQHPSGYDEYLGPLGEVAKTPATSRPGMH